MNRGPQGRQLVQRVPGEQFRAFVPVDLPPNPPLQSDSRTTAALEHACLALGRLDGLSEVVESLDMFLYFYIRKEAVVSSQIEGTQSSLNDLLLFEIEATPGFHAEDARQVLNYVKALSYGIGCLREGAPLTIRLLREMHRLLLASGRGGNAAPGEYRTSQNWIGGSRPGNAIFVPPPPGEVARCVGALEKFWHNQPVTTQPLIKAALVHVQFETIHPFLDGNGRLGRMLITLILCNEKVLAKPLLYLSLGLKRRRDEYYSLLQRVRMEGVWEEWLLFFLEVVEETARRACETAQRIRNLETETRILLQKVGPSSGTLLRLHAWMNTHPVFSAPSAAAALNLSHPTVMKAIRQMVGMHILAEVDGRKRRRLFMFQPLLQIMNEGTEPLESS
ncbi:MAG: Fic family protein [Armatimonadetes bacterium]|nr:Fic family protein [Armatimonadota bacterium]MDE2205834.1 Fic family protein [Armatimonadota bacterium]